jgi:tellurite resistance protein
MDAALLKLNKMTPLAKRSFLDACSKVAEHDGVISDTEIQIIRGIAAALSCPLGPVSASSS